MSLVLSDAGGWNLLHDNHIRPEALALNIAPCVWVVAQLRDGDLLRGGQFLVDDDRAVVLGLVHAVDHLSQNVSAAFVVGRNLVQRQLQAQQLRGQIGLEPLLIGVHRHVNRGSRATQQEATLEEADVLSGACSLTVIVHTGGVVHVRQCIGGHVSGKSRHLTEHVVDGSVAAVIVRRGHDGGGDGFLVLASGSVQDQAGRGDAVQSDSRGGVGARCNADIELILDVLACDVQGNRLGFVVGDGLAKRSRAERIRSLLGSLKCVERSLSRHTGRQDHARASPTKQRSQGSAHDGDCGILNHTAGQHERCVIHVICDSCGCELCAGFQSDGRLQGGCDTGQRHSARQVNAGHILGGCAKGDLHRTRTDRGQVIQAGVSATEDSGSTTRGSVCGELQSTRSRCRGGADVSEVLAGKGSLGGIRAEERVSITRAKLQDGVNRNAGIIHKAAVVKLALGNAGSAGHRTDDVHVTGDFDSHWWAFQTR